MRKNAKNVLHVISAEKSKSFIKDFNETVIPEDFISSCKSVGLLFQRKTDNNKENEELHIDKEDKKSNLINDFRERIFYIFLDSLKIFIHILTGITYMSLLIADLFCFLFLLNISQSVNFIIVIMACLVLIFVLAFIISVFEHVESIAIIIYENCEGFLRKNTTYERLKD